MSMDYFADFLCITSGNVRATGTYLFLVPSNNDVIYFPSKNNTRLSFPSINNDVNYNPSKTNNVMNYGCLHIQKKVKCVPKKNNTLVPEVGTEN